MTIRLPEKYLAREDWIHSSQVGPRWIYSIDFWICHYEDYICARDDRRAWLVRQDKYWRRHGRKNKKNK